MKEIVKSRWRFVKKQGCNTSTFLRALGIEFRKDADAADDSFMAVNASILPELYEQMQEEARLRIHELHPDKGGDSEEFAAFIEAYNAVKKRFRRCMPVPKPETVVVRFVKNQRKAKQAKARRQRNLEGYRAKRRALYARQKAAGTLFVRKNKPRYSAAALARQKMARNRLNAERRMAA